MRKLLCICLFLVSCTNHSDINKKLKAQIKSSPEKLDLKLIEKFAALSYECIDKHYPYKPGVVLYKKSELMEPHKRHPIFYGCYDWHSAVHGHWALVKILNHFPELSFKDKVIEKLKKHFTESNFKKEAQFFKTESAKTFERPYGIAWFLRLIEELDKSNDPLMKTWRQNAIPLEQVLVKKMKKYFTTFSYPTRVGVHENSAFSMNHAWDYAEQVNNTVLKTAIKEAALKWFKNDKLCPVHIEPSGGDFISPCLATAHLMSKVLLKEEFNHWFKTYFPPLKIELNQSILFPPITKNIKDPVAGHLVGLIFQRAWSMEAISKKISDDHPYKKLFHLSRDLHLQRGKELMFDTGYGGTHWLASFAIYALI